MKKKNRKFDIHKTFDIFNYESMGILKKRIVNFVLVEADNFFAKAPSLKFDFDKNDDINCTIVNNKKVYNLLSNAWHKQQKKKKNENIKC